MNPLERAKRIVALLETLPASSRVCFAALCAERLRPAAEEFVMRPQIRMPAKNIAQILDELWASLINNIAPPSPQNVLNLWPQIPHLDEDDSDWSSDRAFREDAAAAANYAIMAWRYGRVEDAAWASIRVFDALDYYITTHTRMYQESLDGREKEQAAALMQNELSYQLSDIDALRGLADTPLERQASLRAIRQTAKDNSYKFLQPQPDPSQ